MNQSLADKRILITSGPTFAPLDAVRSITNHSSGRLGSAIASVLLKRDAEVIFLAGETSLTPQELYPDQDLHRLQRIPFRTVPELKEQIGRILSQTPIHAVLMAAAVLDYLPVETMPQKKSSREDEWIITLKRGEKIIEQIRRWSPQTILIGFKLEAQISYEDLIARAQDLMDRSDADLVVANRIEEIGLHQHVGYLVDRSVDAPGFSVSSALPTREAIAENIAAWLEKKFT